MPRGIHMRGRKLPKEVCLKISHALKGKMPKNINFLHSLRGDKRWNWKGDKVGYTAVHDWVKSILGNPKKCESCGSVKAKKFEWANISGEYKRDVLDWKRTCTSCHRKFFNNPVKKFKKEYRNNKLRYANI